MYNLNIIKSSNVFFTFIAVVLVVSPTAAFSVAGILGVSVCPCTTAGEASGTGTFRGRFCPTSPFVRVTW